MMIDMLLLLIVGLVSGKPFLNSPDDCCMILFFYFRFKSNCGSTSMH